MARLEAPVRYEVLLVVGVLRPSTLYISIPSSTKRQRAEASAYLPLDAHVGAPSDRGDVRHVVRRSDDERVDARECPGRTRWRARWPPPCRNAAGQRATAAASLETAIHRAVVADVALYAWAGDNAWRSCSEARRGSGARAMLRKPSERRGSSSLRGSRRSVIRPLNVRALAANHRLLSRQRRHS
jgi:hypothetical protein